MPSKRTIDWASLFAEMIAAGEALQAASRPSRNVSRSAAMTSTALEKQTVMENGAVVACAA